MAVNSRSAAFASPACRKFHAARCCAATAGGARSGAAAGKMKSAKRGAADGAGSAAGFFAHEATAMASAIRARSALRRERGCLPAEALEQPLGQLGFDGDRRV